MKTHYSCNSCGASGDACELLITKPHKKPTQCPLFSDDEQDERADWKEACDE